MMDRVERAIRKVDHHLRDLDPETVSELTRAHRFRRERAEPDRAELRIGRELNVVVRNVWGRQREPDAADRLAVLIDAAETRRVQRIGHSEWQCEVAFDVDR